MAAVSQPASGIPQPVSKARGTSRLMSMQAQFQQRAAADRQKRLGELAPPAEPARRVEPPRHAAAPGRTTVEPGLRPAAPAAAAPRGRVTAAPSAARASASASATSASAGGGGKVRAMFQNRRAGNVAQTSPIGWDKSYPLDPIGKKSAPSSARQPLASSTSATNSSSSAHARQSASSGAVSDLVQTEIQGSRSCQNLVVDGTEITQRMSSSSTSPAISDETIEADSPPAVTGHGMRTSRTAPAIFVEPESRDRRDREAELRRVTAELRRRERELLAHIKASSVHQTVPPRRRPIAAKPTGGARSRRPEPAAPAPAAAPEPRRSAPPRAAPAPAPARTPRAPATKENQPPTPRAPPTDPNLAQCPICTRSFAKDRLDKHKVICEKSTKKKRKVFDPVKMRVQGTESESYLRKMKNKKPESQQAPPKKDWRKQHEEFIRNIRAAKKAQAHLAAGGSIKDLPPPPPMDTSDYVQCPHCSRRFNEGAADRHIPKCANISSNKRAPARASKPTGRSAAVARTRR